MAYYQILSGTLQLIDAPMQTPQATPGQVPGLVGETPYPQPQATPQGEPHPLKEPTPLHNDAVPYLVPHPIKQAVPELHPVLIPHPTPNAIPFLKPPMVDETTTMEQDEYAEAMLQYYRTYQAEMENIIVDGQHDEDMFKKAKAKADAEFIGKQIDKIVAKTEKAIEDKRKRCKGE